MVSRYLVDGMVIAGLVVGMAGVFYLAYGRLGKGVVYALSWLLVTVLVLLFGIVNDPSMDPAIANASLPEYAGWFIWAYVAGSGVFVVSLCAWAVLHLRGQHPMDWFRRVLRSPFWWILLAALMYIVGGIVVYAAHPRFDQPLVAELGVYGMSQFLVIVSIYSAVPAASRLPALPRRQFQIVGLLLTLVGIVVQFAPLALDLLNIKQV